MSSQAVSLQASSLAAGAEIVTEFNGQGFPVIMTLAAGQAKSYDNQGFLVTSAPAAAVPSKTDGAQAADSTTSPASSGINVVKVVNMAAQRFSGNGFGFVGAFCALFGGLV